MRFFERYWGLVRDRDVFVETGTFRGESLALALRAGFKHVHSVEWCDGNFESCLERFCGDERVSLYHGSSPLVLASLCPLLARSGSAVTFWLDAHYQAVSELESDLNVGQCPLLAELGMIFSCEWVVPPLVLIDDAHCFRDMAWPFQNAVGVGFRRGDWPLLSDIKDLLPPGFSCGEFDDVLILEKNLAG